MFRLFEREVIMGCHTDAPLLVRWKILSLPWFRLCLHIFHRSDEDRELHDHPWSFFSLILWNGYTEVRPIRPLREMLAASEDVHKIVPLWKRRQLFGEAATHERKRLRPGSLIFRPARWTHRIEIPPNQVSVSLVLMLRKEREWGFFTREGWRHWKQFTNARDCG